MKRGHVEGITELGEVGKEVGVLATNAVTLESRFGISVRFP